MAVLTRKHQETHGCVFKTVATDALRSVDKKFIVLEWFHAKIIHS